MGADSSPFLAEFHGNSGSDVEDEEEFDAVRPQHVAPVERSARIQKNLTLSLESETETDEEENESSALPNSEWKVGATKPTSMRFEGASGLQTEIADDATPLDYLHLMIDGDMVEQITIETNRYAATTLRAKNLSPNSRFHHWVDVTVAEMWSFLGLIVAMGLIVVSDMDDYWSTDEVFSMPFFRTVMKRQRFCLILSFLHLCFNSSTVTTTTAAAAAITTAAAAALAATTTPIHKYLRYRYAFSSDR
ncbi:hypothetical protein RRG08_021045 [Elysia crispata]|uniref:PiggyBac transposable element-derived protein domain-containing protein n=1 Tax=Elysia crispata TaxID=231223 RepID=A0AAE1D3B2_9GAST|nr:hypothetical protein RRG08_021045 [Elysia crispata]